MKILNYFPSLLIFNFKIADSEHERTSRSSTSQGGGGYSDRLGLNKKVIFKADNRGDNHFRKSWDGTNDLVRNQLKSEFSNQNRVPGRRYIFNFC